MGDLSQKNIRPRHRQSTKSKAFQVFVLPRSYLGIAKNIPSGELSHSNGKIHHFSWENPLFLWPFSIAMLVHQRVPQGCCHLLICCCWHLWTIHSWDTPNRSNRSNRSNPCWWAETGSWERSTQLLTSSSLAANKGAYQGLPIQFLCYSNML